MTYLYFFVGFVAGFIPAFVFMRWRRKRKRIVEQWRARLTPTEKKVWMQAGYAAAKRKSRIMDP